MSKNKSKDFKPFQKFKFGGQNQVQLRELRAKQRAGVSFGGNTDKVFVENQTERRRFEEFLTVDQVYNPSLDKDLAPSLVMNIEPPKSKATLEKPSSTMPSQRSSEHSIKFKSDGRSTQQEEP